MIYFWGSDSCFRGSIPFFILILFWYIESYIYEAFSHFLGFYPITLTWEPIISYFSFYFFFFWGVGMGLYPIFLLRGCAIYFCALTLGFEALFHLFWLNLIYLKSALYPIFVTLGIAVSNGPETLFFLRLGDDYINLGVMITIKNMVRRGFRD